MLQRDGFYGFDLPPYLRLNIWKKPEIKESFSK